MTKDELIEALELAVERRQNEKWRFFVPYLPQQEFFALGASKRERGFFAGNQTGKSEAGAFETTCHLTGVYPAWWKGKRFEKPTTGWAGGETGEVVRDVQQKKLCGEPANPEAYGTGMIPKKYLLGHTAGHGVSNLYDNIQVRHVPTGGVSVLGFKAYVQGRARWQGPTLDFVWLDEEPPADVYGEALARLTGPGMLYATFTPLLGYSEVVSRFRRDRSEEAARDRGWVQMGLRHVTHFSEEEKVRRLAGYPAHEREARSNGDPLLGSGAVFEEVMPADIRCSMRLSQVPAHWALLWAVDFGINHPFAAVLLAWDRDTDTLYVVHAIRMQGGIPLTHSRPMLQTAARAPVAWPHDGTQRDKGSGQQLADIYRETGLAMLPTHATFETGGYSTEAGIMEMLERMRDGRFKVAEHLVDWWDEFGGYHRKDGEIVKESDDLLSATRIGVMARRFAKATGIGPGIIPVRAKVAAGVGEFEYWS